MSGRSLSRSALLAAVLVVAGPFGIPVSALGGQGRPTQDGDRPAGPTIVKRPDLRVTRTNPVAKAEIFGTEDEIKSIYLLVGNTAVTPEDPSGGHPSTANVAQFAKNLSDAGTLPVRAANLVSLGGLVANGVDDGGQTLKARLEAWDAFARTQPLPRFFAVAGREIKGSKGQVDPGAVKVWREWATARAGMPKAAAGESLNYTVSLGRHRLVFLDTVTRANGSIDAAWLQRELDAAARSRDVDLVFVFGNDPLIQPSGTEAPSADDPFLSSSEVLAARTQLALQPKVAGYFCGGPGHVSATRFRNDRQAMQIVFGAGGGPLDPSWDPPGGQFLGFGALVVYHDGRVALVPMTRPVPEGDLGGEVESARPVRSIPLLVPLGVAK